jgi:phthiodiolone/phenolphthiodiolone dimycocerosates ketoreductase
MSEKRLRFGVQLRTGSVTDIVEQSVLCEKLGFDSIWYPDHLTGGHPTLQWLDVITAMTMMGSNTSRIIVGSGATDSLKRHPSILAQAFASVDQITSGRTALGIGAGEAMNLLPFGIPMVNLCSKLKEAIQVIKLLWAADFKQPASFDGEYYRLNQAFLQVKPIMKPHPPIYVGAFEPMMLEMTGQLADGWLPFSHTPETYKQCLCESIKTAAEKAGRSLKEIEPAMLPATSISKDHDKARKDIEDAAKRFLVLLPSILRKIAPQVEHPGNHYTLAYWKGAAARENQEIIARTAEQIPTEVALRTVIWGTPADCIEQVEEFAEAGCRHFVFGIRGRDFRETIQLLGSGVISYFKEREKK